MKIFALIACLISAVSASGLYGHHIPARLDIAPGSVQTVYSQHVVPQAIVTSYKTPITAPVIAKVPIIGKQLLTSTSYHTVAAPHYAPAHGYAKGGLY